MEGKGFLLKLIIYTAVISLITTFFVLLFFRIFPDKIVLAFIVSPGIGLIFAVLFYLPFKSGIEK